MKTFFFSKVDNENVGSRNIIYIAVGSKTLGYVYVHVAQYYWVINM